MQIELIHKEQSVIQHNTSDVIDKSKTTEDPNLIHGVPQMLSHVVCQIWY